MDDIELEEVKTGGIRLWLAKAVVYGTVGLVTAGFLYIALLSNIGIDILVDASVSLSGPLQVFVWFLAIFVILVMLGSYAQVFGVGFLSSIGNTILDMMDNFERR